MWPFRKKRVWGCLPYEKEHEWLPFTDRELSKDAYRNLVQYRVCSVCNLTQERAIS